MAGYSLIGSYSTVQVLTPTLVNPVVYCTISTKPSGAIASMPVAQDAFDASQAAPELTAFANAIEQVLGFAGVTTAVGGQTIDPSGLISDNVVFTVTYSGPETNGNTISTEATVPVASLNFEDGLIGATLLESVTAIIVAAHESLVSAAGG